MLELKLSLEIAPVVFSLVGFFLILVPLAIVLTRKVIPLEPLVAVSSGTIHGANLGLIGAWIAMCIDVTIRGLFFLTRRSRNQKG